MTYAAPYPSNVPPPTYSASFDEFNPAAQEAKIRDWLPWSIVNLVIGWGLGGIVPLVFSILCRNSKKINDMNTAQSMGTLALAFNIVITIMGILAWVGFIVYIVISVKLVKDVVDLYP